MDVQTFYEEWKKNNQLVTATDTIQFTKDYNTLVNKDLIDAVVNQSKNVALLSIEIQGLKKLINKEIFG